jgi:hypothetical protein
MSNITRSNIIAWPITVMRTRSVAPTYGFGMGDVCPQATGNTSDFGGAAVATRKRHLDAVQATPVSGPMPWSPPVT